MIDLQKVSINLTLSFPVLQAVTLAQLIRLNTTFKCAYSVKVDVLDNS